MNPRRHSTGRQLQRVAWSFVAMGCPLLLGGCSQISADRQERERRGYVFYCDGSGGGGLIRNYSSGIRQGLLDAGYAGSGEMFNWHTGLGVTADHTSSEEYKRGKARQLADRIAEYARKQPGAPITLMGLSAGTAVAVFALEALPRDVLVANVVLLSPSIGADYDLTTALRQVTGRMYVFTSTKDAVLTYLVRSVGTADRREGEPAGIYGFRRPLRASQDTSAQYAKVVHIQWRQEFARYGDLGGHTDVVKAPFVQNFVAPLVMMTPSRDAPLSRERMVRNPDYDRWAELGAGSWVMWRGTQEIGGSREPIRLLATLVERDANTLIVERRYFAEQNGDEHPFRIQTFIEKARIEPEEHPLTHPRSKVVALGEKTFTIDNRPIRCKGSHFEAPAEFPDWGRNLKGTAYGSETIPGYWANVSFSGSKGDESFTYEGQVASYRIVH